MKKYENKYESMKKKYKNLSVEYYYSLTMISKLKEELKGTNTESIKAQTEAVTKKFYEISEKLYKQAAEAQAAAQGADAGAGAPNGDNVVDADYTQVD